jgi:hypothetical protein
MDTERIVYAAKKIEGLKDFKEVLDETSNTFILKVEKVILDNVVASKEITLSKRLKTALYEEIKVQIEEEENKLIKIIKKLEQDVNTQGTDV